MSEFHRMSETEAWYWAIDEARAMGETGTLGRLAAGYSLDLWQRFMRERGRFVAFRKKISGSA